MEAAPAVQNIHVKDRLFPICEPFSTGCAKDLQDAIAHDTGHEATRGTDEQDTVYGAEEDGPPRGECREHDAATDGDVDLVEGKYREEEKTLQDS